MSATDTSTLLDYAPIPRAALGPALNEQGYYVGRVERNLYYVTDGTYMAAFLTTSDGVVVLATWLDQTRELVPARTRLLEDKVVVDPSNPIGFDENGRMFRTLPLRESAGSVVAGLLPESAHYVKAFGTLGADQLATSANREPRVVLFYATDDDAAEATAQRVIRAAGFEPLKVGGVSDAGRIEGPDGGLQGRIFDLDEARATIATKGVKP